ncbi:TPA: hypothetical protein LA460_000215 [Clostridium botulinum]|nr:hypothetical protein [Clostridium botulinum]HBJ1652819.1 hypothetical protein [Clostridium botulinum]
MVIKSTKYCDILKEASIENQNKDCKMSIEEIYVNDEQRNEIRFAYYKLNENGNYKLVVRPLDVTEDELFELTQKAIQKDIINNINAKKIKEIIEATEIGNSKNEAFNDTDYCRFYARGSFSTDNIMYTIEQIFIKDLDRREIRFGYYKKNKNENYQLVTRALDVTEKEFVVMFKDAIKNGVFSAVFLTALKSIL